MRMSGCLETSDNSKLIAQSIIVECGLGFMDNLSANRESAIQSGVYFRELFFKILPYKI